MTSTPPSRFAKWSLIVGIIIVLNMFFNYAISLVYPSPEYPTPTAQVVDQYATKQDCLAAGGQWNETTSTTPAPKDEQPQRTGYCDPDYTVRMQYEAAHKVYQRAVFIILMILGVLSLMVGVFVRQDVLAAAFSWGGVLSLVIASMRYWSEADNIVKVVLLALALAGLIWTALRKFGKR